MKIRGSNANAIAGSVEAGIQAGLLRPGERLPTVRVLASALKVSPVTVAAAYRQLQARGLIVAGGRRGTAVRAAPAAALPAAGAAMPADGVTDLATGNPDPALLPPLDAALRSVRHASRLYGEEPLLQSLVTFAADELAADGLPGGAMTVAGGALDAIERLLREHLRPGDRVAIEDPGVPVLSDLIGTAGYLIEPMAVDAEGPLPDSVEQAIRRGVRAVIITPRAQNPTGAALSAARAGELRRVLQRRDDLLLIENDPFGPVAGVPAATVAAGHARWALVRSVSKFLGPDLRVALLAGDEMTIRRVQGRHALAARWVSHILQQLTLSLWSDPSSGRRLARAAAIYAQRRVAAIDALAAHGITVTARSGFNIWVPVREETAAVQSLAQRGWAVAAGERFRVRAGPGIRVTTSALAVEEAPRFAADCSAALRPSAAASA